MSTFSLQIVTPDGISFDGQAEKLIVRTISGEVCILPRHINFVTTLGMGETKVYTEEGVRRAACIGGMISVSNGTVRLVPSTFEWAEDIDVSRAERSKEAAEKLLAGRNNMDKREISMAEAKLKRALVRQSVAKGI